MEINKIDKYLLQKEVENASLEAIYWWNRSENYYHKSFKNLDSIYKNKKLLLFFKNKVFEVFLREYSIRRNLSSGRKSIDLFIALLFNEIYRDKKNIFDSLKKGNISAIDYFSSYIVKSKIISGSYIDKEKKKKNKYLSNNRKTISLISKIAFLINPKKFYLYDTLAKKSITKTLNELSIKEKKSNTSYENYHYNLDLLKTYFNKNKLFNSSFLILENFKNTEAFSFFYKDKESFKNRIIDKFLWIREINRERLNKKEKTIDNSHYKSFLKVL